MPPKTLQELREKKERLEKELAKLQEFYSEILKMSETGMLCSETKRTIHEYKEIIAGLNYQIQSYEK